MGGLVTMILYVEPTEVYHAWCGHYATFCLFSEGRAINLTEAHAKCNKIKKHSWPVELDYIGIKVVLDEYIKNYSISNVILNAIKDDKGNWFWSNGKKIQVDGIPEISKVNGILVYRRSDSASAYEIVCATECHGRWRDINKARLSGTQTRLQETPTLDGCKSHCEMVPECSSVDWEPVTFYRFVGCTLNFYPYDKMKLINYGGGSHHILNRSNKNIGRCIGNYEGDKPTFSWSMLFITLILSGYLIITFVVLSMKIFGERVQFLSLEGRSSLSQGTNIV